MGLKTNSSAILVPPPKPAGGTNDIRGIKPPVEIPTGWAWLGWGLAGALVLALALAAWRRWRRRPAPRPSAPLVPAHVRARQKLQAALAHLENPRVFCYLVSSALRIYLEERFDFRAPQRTTEHFLTELRSTRLLTENQKQSLGEFLQICDLVKFARLEPTETELRAVHESALRLIDETQYDPIDPASPATADTTPPAGPPPASPAPPPVEQPEAVASGPEPT